MLSNNGYADIGTNPTVATALQTAGFTVIATIDQFGRRVYRAFTKKAQEALSKEPFGISTYKEATQHIDMTYKVEDMLLAQAEDKISMY